MELTYHLNRRTYHAKSDDTQDLILQVADAVEAVWPGILSADDYILFAEDIVYEKSDTGFNPHRYLSDVETFRVF